VLTAMPSYPQSVIYDGYKNKWYTKEKEGNLTIYRSWIFVSRSKAIVARLLNYFSFVFTALVVGLFCTRKHDIIICESPPLFLGITALILKWTKKSKLIFNVSDLWPESAEKLTIITNKTLLGLSYKLESFLYKNADLVSGQTQGIMDNILQRFPKIQFHLLRNGIDTKQFSATGNRKLFRETYNIKDDAFVIAYAGIIGHAQGLDILIEAANLLKHNHSLVFLLVGNGPVKEKLIEMVKTYVLENVIFVDSVPRSQMPDVIAACDCYVTPLRKNDLFLGAIPSKIFEPLYYGKPVIMGVDGEAKQLFVTEGKCALHFEPENTTELVAQINLLYQDKNLYNQLSVNGKTYVSTHFDREKIATTFWKRIQSI
jgi:glycosyltransferase involved in cell wall biosynthesis